MHKHTEGPWKVHAIFPNEAKGHTFDPVVSICAHSKEFNSTIRLADIPDVLSEDSEEMANAELIAKAPTMYKTLQGLITLLDEIEEQSEGQYPHKAPHCIRCTEGATPDKYNTGLCALHMAKELLKGAE